MTAGNVSADEAVPKSAAANDHHPVPLSGGDARGQLPAGARPARNAIIGAAVIGYAWILGGAAPFSTRALLEVLLPGAAPPRIQA